MHSHSWRKAKRKERREVPSDRVDEEGRHGRKSQPMDLLWITGSGVVCSEVFTAHGDVRPTDEKEGEGRSAFGLQFSIPAPAFPPFSSLLL